MVTHHTTSPITANPWAWSRPPPRISRSVVSRIAVMDQSSGPVSAGRSLAFWRFHATRQRAEQNRACSRRGANTVPHCSQSRVSAITDYVTRNGTVLRAVGGYGRRVPDAIFAHPRLAPVYDAFDGGREDLAAYLA